MITVCAILPHEKLLLLQSRKIVAVPGWDGAYRQLAWSSDTNVWLEGNENFSGGNISLFVYNTRTGIQKPHAVWQKRLQQRQDKYNTFWISPDGVWLLCTDYYKAAISATTASGTPSVCWHSALWDSKNKGPLTRYLGWHGIHWFPDSRHWVQSVFNPTNGQASYLAVRDVGSPTTLLHVPIPVACQPLFTAEDYDTVYLSSMLLVQEQFPSILYRDASVHVVTVYEADLALATPPRKHRITLPAEWQVQQIQLSPQASQLAWVVHTRWVLPIVLLMQRMHIPVNIASTEVTSLYISDLEGQNFREIGHVPTPPEPNQDIKVKWMPEGKQISFVYKNVLYACFAGNH